MSPAEIREVAAQLLRPGCPMDVARIASKVLLEYAAKEERDGEA